MDELLARKRAKSQTQSAPGGQSGFGNCIIIGREGGQDVSLATTPVIHFAVRGSMFFSFDGLDGVGKTTQRELFLDWLRSSGHEVVACQDPGSTPLGEAIRGILLGHQVPISRASEMLLFMAARAQLVEDVIRPALEQGKTVVSDRYLLANAVYQGHAGGLDVETIWRIGEVATGGLMPDLVFVLDMPPQAAAARIVRQLDRLESRGADYQSRLRQGFLSEAAKDPRGIVVIDAARDAQAVQADIRAAAARVLKAH
jgi:dTMP kinase